jgi:DNA-binding NtrC family response regulator
LAVEAMRRGAKDFVQKPWDNARLMATLRAQLELGSALRRSTRLEAENLALRGEMPEIIAESSAMRRVMELVARVAPSDANVLLLGENGTGKSLLARAIHGASERAKQAFITLNAGGFSETLLETELFGNVKGAFTDAKQDRAGRFELADGGTLFLDEIGNAPLSLQTKLLRVLESGEFERVGSARTQRSDVRLISATNADLTSEVAAGRFRQDLRFRLNTVEIQLPALRERQEDILPLANHFLARHAARRRKAITEIEPRASEALRAYPWPGNVRELDHAIERAVLLTQDHVLQAANLMLSQTQSAMSLEDLSLEDVEAALIRKAIARHGSATLAAEALGLSRSAIYRRMQRLGIGGS